MKSLGKVALVGVSGIVLFKVGTALVFPMLGLVLALLSLAVKFLVIAGIGYVVYQWLTKKKESDVEVHEVHEVEVEVE